MRGSWTNCWTHMFYVLHIYNHSFETHHKSPQVHTVYSCPCVPNKADYYREIGARWGSKKIFLIGGAVFFLKIKNNFSNWFYTPQVAGSASGIPFIIVSNSKLSLTHSSGHLEFKELFLDRVSLRDKFWNLQFSNSEGITCYAFLKMRIFFLF